LLIIFSQAETFVEKAASIVGNRGNDDVDDLVAFINSTSEEDKASTLKKGRKSKGKQPRPSPSMRGEADHESHKESEQGKFLFKSNQVCKLGPGDTREQMNF
jgi:hypothetical protein